MRNFIDDVIMPTLFVGALAVAFLIIIIIPVTWFEGHAKADYLKQTKHVDMEWYNAAWIDVHFVDLR